MIGWELKLINKKLLDMDGILIKLKYIHLKNNFLIAMTQMMNHFAIPCNIISTVNTVKKVENLADSIFQKIFKIKLAFVIINKSSKVV